MRRSEVCRRSKGSFIDLPRSIRQLRLLVAVFSGTALTLLALSNLRDPDCWKKANLASAFFEPNNVAFGSSLRHKNHDAAGSHQVGISGNCNLCARVPNVTRRQERSIERAIPTSSGNRWQLKI